MQTAKEKTIMLKEKKLELIKGLMTLPVKYITEYNNYEINGILYDIESDLKPYYNKDTKCFGLRLKNNIMLYIQENIPTGRVALYARVSSSKNKSNLDTQMERLKLYASDKGYNIVAEVKEVGSGMDEDRPKLNKLLSKPEDFDILVVEHKDRLIRFGFRFIELMMFNLNKRIEVINFVPDNNKGVKP